VWGVVDVRGAEIILEDEAKSGIVWTAWCGACNNSAAALRLQSLQSFA
jgi:hypothetical protein